MSVLAEIIEATKVRVEEYKQEVPFSVLEKAALSRPAAKDFAAIFKRDAFNVIAEVKRASPSRGEIFIEADYCEVARGYLVNGAVALSVLTEPQWFKGDLQFLKDIRNENPDAYLLMKEFIVDGYQLLQARELGADAVLLIVAALDDEKLQGLYDMALELGLTALVEVHNEEEMARAAMLGAKLIGVNSRNLKTMQTSLDNLFAMQKLTPAGATLIAESGIESKDDMTALRAAGYDGFLIGTAFMKTHKPAQAIKELLS